MVKFGIGLESALKVTTYCLLFSMIIIGFWAYNWKVSAEFDALILFFIAYTLLLVLPITNFELSWLGFKGEMKRELERLTERIDASPVSVAAVREVDDELIDFSKGVIRDDTVLMKLSIEIETTLREIAESAKVYDEKVPAKKMGMNQLIQALRQKEILTDRWLLAALHFFRIHRNELLHEGKTDDIVKAINVGIRALAELREIKQQIRR